MGTAHPCPMGASGDSQQGWHCGSCRSWECSPKLALQGEFGFAEHAVGRGCRGQSRAEHRALLPALGLLAAGITRGRGVITAQRPRTQNDCGQESPTGLGGGSAECCEGTIPRGATLAVMPNGSWLRCSAIKIGLGSRPAGEALPVPGLAMAMPGGICSLGRIG